MLLPFHWRGEGLVLDSSVSDDQGPQELLMGLCLLLWKMGWAWTYTPLSRKDTFGSKVSLL